VKQTRVTITDRTNSYGVRFQYDQPPEKPERLPAIVRRVPGVINPVQCIGRTLHFNISGIHASNYATALVVTQSVAQKLNIGISKVVRETS
jgi:hypothetical protein